MTNNTQQLPAGLHAEALAKAKEYSPLTDGNSLEVGKRHGFYDGYVACGDKPHTARTLLQKFISRHEAGLLPDRFIYDEIKQSLK